MCETICECIDEWPLAKLHRWLGYLQAGLIANGIVDEVRARRVSVELHSDLGTVVEDSDLADHLDPAHPFCMDIGGEG